MREHIAQVTHNQLMPLGGDQQNTAAIPVGSEAWYSWVTDLRNRAFSLRNHRGTFTARCERQRNSWYWYLYSKRAGKLYKAYLGKAETLTPERLDTVTATLVGRWDAQAITIAKARRRSEQPPAGSASRTDTSVLASSTALDEAAADAGWDALLKTKVALPVARANLVPRLGLISWMETAIYRPLTLISAPAGFGKTTLLYDWIRQRQQPVAWLSLDVGDNVLGQIWRYVIAALHECYPTLDSHALAGQLLRTRSAHRRTFCPEGSIRAAIYSARRSGHDLPHNPVGTAMHPIRQCLRDIRQRTTAATRLRRVVG